MLCHCLFCLQALEFLEQLLVYDPKKRLSAREAAAVSTCCICACVCWHALTCAVAAVVPTHCSSLHQCWTTSVLYLNRKLALVTSRHFPVPCGLYASAKTSVQSRQLSYQEIQCVLSSGEIWYYNAHVVHLHSSLDLRCALQTAHERR